MEMPSDVIPYDFVSGDQNCPEAFFFLNHGDPVMDGLFRSQ